MAKVARSLQGSESQYEENTNNNDSDNSREEKNVKNYEIPAYLRKKS